MLLLGSASSIASFFSAFAGGMGSRRAAPPRLSAEGRKLLAGRNRHHDILSTDSSNDTVAEGKHATRGFSRTWMDQEDFPWTTWPCCSCGALTHCPTLLSLSNHSHHADFAIRLSSPLLPPLLSPPILRVMLEVPAPAGRPPPRPATTQRKQK